MDLDAWMQENVYEFRKKLINSAASTKSLVEEFYRRESCSFCPTVKQVVKKLRSLNTHENDDTLKFLNELCHLSGNEKMNIDMMNLPITEQIKFLAHTIKMTRLEKERIYFELKQNWELENPGKEYPIRNIDELIINKDVLSVTTDSHGNFPSLFAHYALTGEIVLEDAENYVVIIDRVTNRSFITEECMGLIITIWISVENYKRFHIFSQIYFFLSDKCYRDSDNPLLEGLLLKCKEIIDVDENRNIFFKDNCCRFIATVFSKKNKFFESIGGRNCNLGDVIDRGPCSATNLTFMLFLGSPFCMGNHEADQIEVGFRNVFVGDLILRIRNILICRNLMTAGFIYGKFVLSHVAPNKLSIIQDLLILSKLSFHASTREGVNKITPYDVMTLSIKGLEKLLSIYLREIDGVDLVDVTYFKDNTAIVDVVADDDVRRKKHIGILRALISIRRELMEHGDLFFRIRKFVTKALPGFGFDITANSISLYDDSGKPVLINKINDIYTMLMNGECQLKTVELIRFHFCMINGIAKSKLNLKTGILLPEYTDDYKIFLECIDEYVQREFLVKQLYGGREFLAVDRNSVSFWLWTRDLTLEIEFLHLDIICLEGHTKSQQIRYMMSNDARPLVIRLDTGMVAGAEGFGILNIPFFVDENLRCVLRRDVNRLTGEHNVTDYKFIRIGSEIKICRADIQAETVLPNSEVFHDSDASPCTNKLAQVIFIGNIAIQTRLAEEARQRAEAAAREEAARQAEEMRKTEEARKLEETRLAEEARQAEEMRKTEEARKAEEMRKTEEARLAEEARKLEETRLAEEERQRAEAAAREEAARQAEEMRKTEEARKAEEMRKTEEARLAEEARKAEEARLAEEARKAEESRLAEEARHAEDAINP
ncbi:MAG: hypothetical protein LBJ93_04485 [Clostridiales bacterium]|jgi:hypothetical protein|nr:hypothetical protein [Clostridiales bacterium]